MATMYTSSRTTAMGPERYSQPPPQPPPRHGSTTSTSSSSSQVRFGGPGANKDEVMQERQKYLTAKYGADQMRLIRKRLAVEDWLDQQLRRLYDVQSETEHYDCIDLDDLLDIDEDVHRRIFIQERIANSRKSPEVVNEFITDLVEQARPLNSLKNCLKKLTPSNNKEELSDDSGTPNGLEDQPQEQFWDFPAI